MDAPAPIQAEQFPIPAPRGHRMTAAAAATAADPNTILRPTDPVFARTLTWFPATLRLGQSRSRSLRGWFAGPDPTTMLDIIFIAGGLAFFAASAGYAGVCDRL